jgi:hypothetical protein
LWSGGAFNVVAHDTNSGEFQLSYADIADFSVDFGGKVVRVCPAADVSEQSIRHLLADQIIPRIFAHEGEFVLHAAGVRRDEGIVLLVGPSGSGKSSLAASLHNSGYHLVGDDVMVIAESKGIVTGRAVYRSLRLFPDSIEALVHGPADFTPVASYTDKQNVIFADDLRSDHPLPVRAAFLLGSPRGKGVVVEPVTSAQACMGFLEHSFWMDPGDLRLTKQRMSQASALAEQVPTFRLAYQRKYSALPAVHRALAGVLD